MAEATSKGTIKSRNDTDEKLNKGNHRVSYSDKPTTNIRTLDPRVSERQLPSAGPSDRHARIMYSHETGSRKRQCSRDRPRHVSKNKSPSSSRRARHSSTNFSSSKVSDITDESKCVDRSNGDNTVVRHSTSSAEHNSRSHHLSESIKSVPNPETKSQRIQVKPKSHHSGSSLSPRKSSRHSRSHSTGRPRNQSSSPDKSSRYPRNCSTEVQTDKGEYRQKHRNDPVTSCTHSRSGRCDKAERTNNRSKGMNITVNTSDTADTTSNHHSKASTSVRHQNQNTTFTVNLPPKDNTQICDDPQSGGTGKRLRTNSIETTECKTDQQPTGHTGTDMICSNMESLMESRPFQKTSFGIHHCSNDRSDSKSFQFRVISYNVLSQDLIEMNPYLYYHCDPRYLDWHYRKRNFEEEFRKLNGDIVCLQEIHCEHYDEFFNPLFSDHGYEGSYIKRSGDKNDGCAIFVRTCAFRVERVVPVEYLHTEVPLLDRDNVALLVLLSLVDDPSTKLCVSNTHLLFNPRRGDVKLAQIMMLLSEIDKLACKSVSPTGQPSYHPVIMCGDFNSTPYCDLYRFLVQGQMEYEDLVIAEMSLQEKQYGREKYLDKELGLEHAGIADQCQYKNIVQQRFDQLGAEHLHRTGNDIVNKKTRSVSTESRSTSNSPVPWTIDTTREDWDMEIEEAEKQVTLEMTSEQSGEDWDTEIRDAERNVTIESRLKQSDNQQTEFKLGSQESQPSISQGNQQPRSHGLQQPIISTPGTVFNGTMAQFGGYHGYPWYNNHIDAMKSIIVISQYLRARSPYGSLWCTPVPLGVGVLALAGASQWAQPQISSQIHQPNQSQHLDSRVVSCREPTTTNAHVDGCSNLTFGSGTASHRLCLLSVYTHGSSSEREVTTCHSRANCTVDYIFYSVDPDRRPGAPRFLSNDVKGGELRLVGARKLFTDKEMMTSGHLPNDVISSDHLSLSADFALGYVRQPSQQD